MDYVWLIRLLSDIVCIPYLGKALDLLSQNRDIYYKKSNLVSQIVWFK